MRLENVELEDAVGGVLIHNIADAQGHKALSKGHHLVEGDMPKLRALGKTRVLVGIFEPGDVSENEAAERIARAAAGPNVTLSTVSGGRVNMFAGTRGVLKVDNRALERLNSLDGITIATIPGNIKVEQKKIVSTVKTIGLAIHETVLSEAETIGRDAQGLIMVRPLEASRVALILSGSPEARERVERTFVPAIRGRVEDLGGTLASVVYVAHEPDAIADALRRVALGQVDCVLLAGETSIMDEGDVTPSAIVQAGGKIEMYGAPVEPGNLLLLAYEGELPIIGAPGCVKSRDTNVVDLILPRLLAGERVEKKDVVALANGGLLL
jgi:hypothetical protein